MKQTIIRVIWAASFALTALPVLAQNVARYDVFQDWAVFADGELCWAATASVTPLGQEMLLVVTTLSAKKAPEVSILTPFRLKKANRMRLTWGGRNFALSVDGKSAWPRKGADAALIRQLFFADRDGGVGPNLRSSKHPPLSFSPAGFGDAYKSFMRKCRRKMDPKLR